MKIAIEGCCHGELDNIYSTIEHLEKINDIKIDLLLICGDFQSTRNPKDLQSMAVPDKYRQMCTFWKYYAGIKTAPVLTIFIGGNHESSNYLCELPYGGWVSPNIYYLGYASVITINGIRIAGLSGIYKSHDYHKGHYEIPPYNPGSMHSVYHVRNLEIHRLSQLKKPIDIMLTHDWPTGIHKYGNCDELLKIKPYFQEDIERNALGSPENEKLLKLLKPKYWFSAHLHVKFAALYKHDDGMHTNFLSLDKCLPKRKFLQVIDVTPKSSENKICLDAEWLCILKKSDHLLNVASYQQTMLSEKIHVTDDDIKEIIEDFQGNLTVPANFKQTAPIFNPDNDDSFNAKDVYLNEQTTLLCEMLSVRDPIRVILEKSGKSALISESKTEMYNNLLDKDDDDVDEKEKMEEN
jgi:lariat debranching enzyme